MSSLVCRSIFITLLAVAPLAYGSDLKMIHKAPPSAELPAPGVAMQLSVHVEGLKNPDPQLRIFMVNDGRLIDAPLTGTYDMQDRVVYEIEVRAPIAELSYQFVMYEEDGSTSLSKRFQVQRPCIPDINLTETEIDPSIMKEERIRISLERARGLENDIRAYSNAVDALKELQKELLEVHP